MAESAAAAALVAEWSIVTTTGRGVLPSPRCGHSLSLTGAGDSGSRHLIVAFGETVRVYAVLLCCAVAVAVAVAVLCCTADVLCCAVI
jgi:hypothetical protein